MFSPLTPASQSYAWRQLASRAGFNEQEIPFVYGKVDHISSPSIIVSRSSDDDWRKILTLHKQDMHWVPASETIPRGSVLPFNNLIPVLFWGQGLNGNTPFVEKLSNGSILFYADIIAATLFMLSRWEETVSAVKDAHGRFPAAHSTAYKLGFLDIPLIDQYGLILREWIKTLAPNLMPQKNIPALNLTHDIDHIYQYSTPLSFARTFSIALLSKQPFKNIGHELSQLKTQIFSPEREERYRAVFDLANISKQHGVKSHFYFMAARPHLQQQGYDPALPRLQKAYKFLQQEGHEIGFHPGYATLGNLKVLKEEKERLEKACDVKVVSGRQHFLKFQVPHTWRDWEQAGMEYDSTMGYADCEGFRCGTCHPFKPFDMETDREINIFEIPLIIMDVTLANYRNMTVEETRALIIDFARRCAEVEGVFTLLWHNTMLLHENLAWKKMYFDVLKQLTEFFKIDVSTYMEGS